MKTIITIGRQFGSGGKEIGIRVAKELGIPFYDKEILQETAKKSGISYPHYNFIENGKRRPSVEVAKRIAGVLGFEWTRFFEDAKGESA